MLLVSHAKWLYKRHWLENASKERVLAYLYSFDACLFMLLAHGPKYCLTHYLSLGRSPSETRQSYIYPASQLHSTSLKIISRMKNVTGSKAPTDLEGKLSFRRSSFCLIMKGVPERHYGPKGDYGLDRAALLPKTTRYVKKRHDAENTDWPARFRLDKYI